MADARCQEALQQILSGVELRRREPKIPYNGADGVPIREEVLERHGETVITRNSYGARCLNTPNVLFADIDFPEATADRFAGMVFLAALLAAIAVGWFMSSKAVGFILVFCAIAGSRFLVSLLRRGEQGKADQLEKAACDRVRAVFRVNPEWGGRVYRTPNGLRVLVTHRPFEPGDPDVQECFELLGADPVYQKMCFKQQCFRARLTAKPWRAGIGDHMRPQPGIWPVASEHMPLRQAWVEKYEAASSSYAACAYLESLGAESVHPAVAPVLELHDVLSKAGAGLPIA